MAAKRKKPTKAPAREYVVKLFTKDGKSKTVHTAASMAEANKLKTELGKKYPGNVYGVFLKAFVKGFAKNDFLRRRTGKAASKR